jgi:protein SCO1/2
MEVMWLRVIGFAIFLSMLGQLHAGETPLQGLSLSADSGAPTGGDFVLQSSDGDISTESFRGKVLLLYFGYTQCPDVCPTSLSLVAQSLNELDSRELEKIGGIFVSVDPRRDTLDVLANYVSYFHPNLVGVTGSADKIADAARLYGVQYSFTETADSAMGYVVNHSANVYLIDQKGELRYAFPHETPPEAMLGAMRKLFQES